MFRIFAARIVAEKALQFPRAVDNAAFMDFTLAVFPLAAAIFYSLSVVLVKSVSGRGGISAVSMLAATNLMMVAVFLPMSLACGMPDFSQLWRPLLVGVFFALGNYTTFLCAHCGEVSLMTPVMGVKIPMVFAVAGIVAGVEPSPSVLIAGFVCCAAVFLMGFDKSALVSGRILRTIALALCSCFFYAVCDVLAQHLVGGFKPVAFLGYASLVLALSSSPFVPKMVGEFSAGGRGVWVAVAAAALMAVESALMFYALSGGFDAALCNIIYNTRGVFSIVLVCALSGVFPELEHLSKASAWRRFAGAAMILAAVSCAVL